MNYISSSKIGMDSALNPEPMKNSMNLYGAVAMAVCFFVPSGKSDAISLNWAVDQTNAFDVTATIDLDDVTALEYAPVFSSPSGIWRTQGYNLVFPGPAASYWEPNPETFGVYLTADSNTYATVSAGLTFGQAGGGAMPDSYSYEQNLPGAMWAFNLLDDGTGTIRIYGSTDGGGSVPSGGSTALMLVVSLGGLAGMRRKLGRS